MRLIFAIVLAGLTVLFASGCRGIQPAGSKFDREQITAAMAAMDETWNKHDMRAHTEHFHEDAVWIAWTGEVFNGADDFEVKLTAIHNTVFSKSFHKGRIEELTFIAPDVAVVRGYGTVVGNEPTPDKVHQYRILVVMTKRHGVWKLSFGQKTRFAESMPDLSSGT